jgi:hypothetical protein
MIWHETCLSQRHDGSSDHRQCCRALRTVPHPRSPVERNLHTAAALWDGNLGRTLLMVDWDDGKATLVFPSDVELVAGE